MIGPSSVEGVTVSSMPESLLYTPVIMEFQLYCNGRAASVDVVYFDYAKAFDSVNHYLLLQNQKLKYSYNIEGRSLKFLTNYLADREQHVIIYIINRKCSFVRVFVGSSASY